MQKSARTAKISTEDIEGILFVFTMYIPVTQTLQNVYGGGNTLVHTRA